jgi:hypothetical protein
MQPGPSDTDVASTGPPDVGEPDHRTPLRYDAEGSPVFEDWDPVEVPADLLEMVKASDAFVEVNEPETRSAHATKRAQRAKGKTRAKPKAKPVGQLENITDEQLLADAGVVPIYSTTEAAQFFNRTNQWLYWGLRGDDQEGPVFIYPDGRPIEPDRIGDPKSGRRRFTLPIIKEILLSSYRRGNIEPEELKVILRRIRINELGGEWREREGWHKIRGKWIHPKRCEQVDGKWVKRADAGADDDD